MDTIRRRAAGVTAGIVRRHRPDVLIMLFMGILMLLGLIVIYSISPALTARINAAGNSLDQNHFMYRQLAYLAAGVVAFFVASFVPVEWWKKHAGKLVLAGLALCFVPLVFSQTELALCTNGACRWINLGFVSLQPAEILKFGLLIFLAGFLAMRMGQGKLNDIHDTLLPIAVVVAVAAFVVIILQKDLGTGLSLLGIVVCMMFAAGLKKKYFLMALAVTIGLGLVTVLTSPHRLERINTFLNTSENKDSTGYHIHQALIAVGSGGVTGKGLGRSVQAFGYLPEAGNDSIFAIVAEKFGFVGTTVILVLFGALFLRILKVLDTTANEYYRLLIAGVFGWIFTHTIVNIGAMLGIFPLTGITLPFLSFGGTSLLFIMLALGVVFNISRYTTYQQLPNEPVKGGPYEDRHSRRRVGRTRNASPRSN